MSSSSQSGGILLGAKKDVFDLVSADVGVFFVSMALFHRTIGRQWEVIGVYGPTDHSISSIFLDELSAKLDSSNLPLLLGGDFNFLRSLLGKNNLNFSWSGPF